MNRVYKLLLVFVFAFTVPVLAAEYEVKFEWSYPDDQSDVIDGFRIYNATNPMKPKPIITVNQGSLRVFNGIIDLQRGDNDFFIVPFIGDREGSPGNIETIRISPFYEINDLSATCERCK